MTPQKAFTFGMQLTGAPDRASWLDLARRAEDLGYSTLSLPDHFGEPFAPFAALGAVAATTERIRLSMGVLANDFRHPVVLAKEAATLDVVSDGRLDLGLGAGWMREEYEAAGIPFDPAPERILRLGETVRIVRALPRPVQRPAPPILLGGGGHSMLGLAAREADIVSVVTANAGRRAGAGLGRDATLERARVKIGWVREAAGDRFGELVLHTRVSVAEITPDAAGVAARLAPAHDLSVDEFLESPHVLVGTLSQLAEKVERLREELGFSSFTLSRPALDGLAPLVEALTPA